MQRISRWLITCATSLMLATSAFGQTTTTTVVLVEQNRQGTLTSASLGPVVATVQRVTARALMSAAVRDDPTASMCWHIFKSRDSGTTWQHDSGACWQGGTGFVDRDGTINPAPRIRYEGQSLDNVRGALVRIEVDIPVRIRVGAEIELVTQ